MIKFNLFQVEPAQAQAAARVEDAIKFFVATTRVNYKLYDRDSAERFYDDFYTQTNVTKELRELGISNHMKFAKLFTGKRQELTNAGWNMSKVHTSKDEKIVRLKNVKKNEPVVKLATDKTPLSRTMVVYDANNPKDKNNIIKYDFKGKNSNKDRTQLNEIKMDWRNRTGNHYFDARPILLSNYNKKFK